MDQSNTMSKTTVASVADSSPNSTSTVDPVSAYGFSERRFTETYGEKAIRKCKENPFVPIGALATTVALIMASTKLRRAVGPSANALSMRNSKQFQYWLRARVAFQTLTILAVCGGVYVFGQPNIDENQKALEVHKELVEGKAARERKEFDERMREAEIVQEQEDAMLAARKLRLEGKVSSSGSGWWPSSWTRSGSTPKSAPAELVKPEVVSKAKTESPVATDDQQSWLGWLGWTKPKMRSERPPSDEGKKV